MLPVLGVVVAGAVATGGMHVVRVHWRMSPPLVSCLRGTRNADSPLPQSELDQPQNDATAGAPPNAAPVALDDSAHQRQLILSGVALGTTCAGHFFFPPLGVLTTPLIIYLEWPMFQTACTI